MKSDCLEVPTARDLRMSAPMIALGVEWVQHPAESHDDFAVCANCGAYYLVDIAAGVEVRKFFLSRQRHEILCERCVRNYGKVATE